MSKTPTIHLIGNAHLDPVWLWDWREGMSEGLSTCRTLVELMLEDPALRIIRGEAAIYAYVERHDPALFRAIARLVKAGRWDIVGGNFIQPDTNMPGTEALLRQFIRGKRYFREKFGVEVTAAWAADSFGHCAGLPEILVAAGMESIAFTRPTSGVYPIGKPAFWWHAPSGARVLCYRPNVPTYYCIERHQMIQRLDETLAEIQSSGLQNVACFYGLGDHGGGPTRGQLHALAAWSANHPEVRVIHSGLHRLFDAIRIEADASGRADYLPGVTGELNFCLRGCSASVAKFKYLYRRAEVQIARAERTSAIVSAFTRTPPASLDRAWDALLFNAFHDILPGSSIERAFDDQIAETGGALNAAQHVETDALLDLARHIDSTAPHWTVGDDDPLPVPVLIFNPHPHALDTQVEIEVSLDYRPLRGHTNDPDTVPLRAKDAAGKILRHQTIREEHDSMHDLAWRRRAVVPVQLPAFGWNIVHLGVEASRARPGRSPVKSIGADTIGNGLLTVTAVVGTTAVTFQQRGQAWLPAGLQVRLFDDPWGAWGGMLEQPDSWNINRVLESWTISRVHPLEHGPERASLWVRFSGQNSHLDLTFQLSRKARHVTILGRAQWRETGKRLKLVLPAGGPALYEVPGATVRREACGEVPGGRWVQAGSGRDAVGFASDALYGFATTTEEFHATVLRSCRYASDVSRDEKDSPWIPPTDQGEHRFKFLLHAGPPAALPALAAALEDPPVVLTVPARPGRLPAIGSLMQLGHPSLKLLALTAEKTNRFRIRIQNTESADLVAEPFWLGEKMLLGTVAAHEIATWQLSRGRTGWSARRIAATS